MYVTTSTCRTTTTPSSTNNRRPLTSTPLSTNHQPSSPRLYYRVYHLLEGLAEHQDLHLIVDGQDTSTGDTTENVGTCTLEERSETLLGDDLATSIEGRLVFDGLTGGHHHTTTDSVQWVRSNTSTSSDTPSEKEGGKEVTLERTDENDRLDRVVHTEVQTTVDDDTSDGRTETTVETSDTIRGEGLLVDIDQAVELTLTTSLGVLVVVGETGTGVVERVDEEEGSSTGSLKKLADSFADRDRRTYTTRGQVTSHPLGISITVLLEGEHRLVGVTESEVQCLGGEVTDNVGSITTPQRCNTLVGNGSSETLHDTIVFSVKTTRLQHLIL
jgi:hypothetical protein